jgi:Na+/melibiose symporter-like transporter
MPIATSLYATILISNALMPGLIEKIGIKIIKYFTTAVFLISLVLLFTPPVEIYTFLIVAHALFYIVFFVVNKLWIYSEDEIEEKLEWTPKFDLLMGVAILVTLMKRL